MSVTDRSCRKVSLPIAAVNWQRSKDYGVNSPLGAVALGQGDGDVAFLLTPNLLSGDGVLGSTSVEIPTNGWALRVDEVAFPVGAIAYRHTHSGSGWRHLVSGSLLIEGERETSVVKAGDSWFEPANTPVRAIATHTTGVTRFVRCMVIPLKDLGHSTFKLQSPEEADLPRLQLTYRHLDHII